ncbi:hypothetical protein SKAU_G00154930 [Synaphobranchus kaupii]|uniref:Uncharacterized protein n=1 Tax=Synaphobranchus kaupii TaxID=118154 RepID=A0A9Q1IYT6_SYNKA|nr:hypothetical protein SKAU_G00154930 [Synaphobranchus kaupii]
MGLNEVRSRQESLMTYLSSQRRLGEAACRIWILVSNSTQTTKGRGRGYFNLQKRLCNSYHQRDDSIKRTNRVCIIVTPDKVQENHDEMNKPKAAEVLAGAVKTTPIGAHNWSRKRKIRIKGAWFISVGIGAGKICEESHNTTAN